MQRIGSAVRIVEGLVGGEAPRPGQAVHCTPNVQMIKPTGAAGSGGAPFADWYPAILQFFDAAANTKSDDAVCWLKEWNAGALEVDLGYISRCVGQHTDGKLVFSPTCCVGDQACVRVMTGRRCVYNPLTGQYDAVNDYVYLRGAFSVSDLPCDDEPPSGDDGRCPGGYANPTVAPCQTGYYRVQYADGSEWCCPNPSTVPPPSQPPPPTLSPVSGSSGGSPLLFSAGRGSGPSQAEMLAFVYSLMFEGSTDQVLTKGADVAAWATASGGNTVLTPANLSADVNNWNPGTLSSGITIIRAQTDGGGNRNVTGLLAGSAGAIAIILNFSPTDNIVLKHLNGGSSAGNQFQNGLSVSDITLGGAAAPNIAAYFCDTTSAVWRLIFKV